RMAGLCFVNAEGNLMFNNQDQVHYLHENHIHFLMEPALTVSGGPEKIKIQFQLSKSYNLTMPAFRQDNTLLTVGLGFGF
ncbi:MAG TPA: hypothetical protein VD905_04825, partial [Flavobacteriales bacterium]|nr:hypothetical protein [Flavobacteriales bacterium]